MKDNKECAICHLLLQSPDILICYDSKIYLDADRVHKIKLCYVHDLELFKIGQERFAYKYSPLSQIYEDAEDRTFFNFLRAHYSA